MLHFSRRRCLAGLSKLKFLSQCRGSVYRYVIRLNNPNNFSSERKFERASKMAKKLYVGNLSYNTTDASLKDAFSGMGEVESANVITDKMTGRSRGFGFVNMVNDAEAEAAIEKMNGADLEGRKLTVNEAKPLSERPPRRNFDNRGGGSRY